MKLDQRQRYSLLKMIEDARRTTREPTVITLCDLLDQTIPTFNPDYRTRQNIPVATVIPETTMHRIAAAHAALRHEEKTIALTQRLLQLSPESVPNNRAPNVPNNPPGVPNNISGDTPVPIKATHPRGRPPSKTQQTPAERKAIYRARKKAELEQVLRGRNEKK